MAYTSRLSLSGLSVQAAMARLAAEGFACYPQKESVSCIRKVEELFCTQKQIVHLPGVGTNQIPLNFSAHLVWVCL